MKIISTETSQVLSSKLAYSLNADIAGTLFKRFPDGELYCRVGSYDDRNVIVGSIVDSDSFLQLLLCIDACEGADNTLVIPYMGYARQDKKFHPGEPISVRALAQALGSRVDEVYTINIHEDSVLGYFEVPAHTLSLAPDIGAFLNTLDLDDPLILAPDAGASAFARDVAGVEGWDCDELKKTRLSGEEVKMEPKSLDAEDRVVVIVDDIISTGGTLATAAGMLYEQQATAVHAACVHGVFASGAYARLCNAGLKSIVSSDTIERGCSLVTAANRIALALSQR